MSIELELAHYGVKGMKWGTRRRDRRAGRKEAQDALERAVQYYGKDFKQRVRDIEQIRAGTYVPKPGDYGYKN